MYSDIVMGFLSPERQKELIAWEKKYLRDRAKPAAIDWDEDKTKFDKLLTLRGKSFQKAADHYKLFEVPHVLTTAPDHHGNKAMVFSPEGNYAYACRELPAYTTLELFQGQKRGHVYFDSEVNIPVLYQHRPNHISKLFEVWMSITPAEVLTLRQGLKLATGKVLIGGLGLGWLLKKVAAKKSVKEIVVVEISQELIDWYGEQLCLDVQNDTGTKVTLICDDVANQVGEHGSDTRHLLDIWSSYPVGPYQLKELKDKLSGVKWWGWGCTKTGR